jgi:hypothetical protein
MKLFKVILMGLIYGIVISGCATIMGDKNQLIPINSSPSEAEIVITDEKDSEIFKGKTPTNVTLEKSDGSYFGGKTYTVLIAKEGYESKTITINSKVSAWYIVGNLGFGGLIGWLIVDPSTGAMYNLSPENISANLPEN